MTPEEFIAAIDQWAATGGPWPEGIPRDRQIMTAAEAYAVCQALARVDSLAHDPVPANDLHSLIAFFQEAASSIAFDAFRRAGLPHLRRLVSAALASDDVRARDDWATKQRHNTQMFALKILAMYGDPRDRPLFNAAARKPVFSDSYLWSVINTILAERHPSAVEICEELAEPLPDGFAGIAYLDFANRLAREGRLDRHPFDCETGIVRLTALLTDADPENSSYARSATASLPFLSALACERLAPIAESHVDPLVRLESAWAAAKMGSTVGRQKLTALCLDPSLSKTAIEYLKELKLDEKIPAAAIEPDFVAMAEMASWLMYPTEFGRPPDRIEQYDRRELYWPPTRDRRWFWLFRYRYEPRGPEEKREEGIGLVGSVTFALFDEATADLPPEDVYGLHCCWELEQQKDARAPKERSAAIGRKILSERNPGFGRRRLFSLWRNPLK